MVNLFLCHILVKVVDSLKKNSDNVGLISGMLKAYMFKLLWLERSKCYHEPIRRQALD